MLNLPMLSMKQPFPPPGAFLARFPSITRAGWSLYNELLQHPDAPRWNHEAGDRLARADLRAVHNFQDRLESKRGRREPGLSDAVAKWVSERREKIPAFRKLPLGARGWEKHWDALPTMSREDVAVRPESLVPDDADLRRMIIYRTAGTTGHALLVPSDPVAVACYQPMIEFALRLIREPRGAVLLALVPFLQMLFLGLRPGYSIAYYVFPLALLLCILASSLAIRMSRIGRWGFLVPFFLGLVAVSDGAFLRGSIKHALILTAPDTRLLARDYLYTRATPGDNILLTHAIGGMNFWGPPLLPQDPPRGTGAFAIASREALRFSEDPRYHLRVVDGFPGFTPDVTRDCDWVIAIGTGPTSEDVREGNRPPQGFELATAIQGVPPQSNFWPFLKSSDYEALHKLSVRSLWRDRVRGLPVMIYKRLDVRGKGEIALR